MFRRSISFAVALALSVPFASVATADPAPSRAEEAALRSAVERQRTRLTAALRPELRAKVLAAAKQLNQRLAARTAPKARPVDPLVAARELVKNPQAFPNTATYSDADIEALTFIVMMNAAKDADDDLAEIMARTKAINQAKQCVRDFKKRSELDHCLRAIQPTPPLSAAALDALIDSIKNKLDSLSEMGETESLRLQMAMDRLSKMMSTLSNILKKISDTDSGVVANMK